MVTKTTHFLKLISVLSIELVLNNFLSRRILVFRHSAIDTRTTVERVSDWLINAHNAGRDGGISNGYSLLRGWDPPHVETTGYTIVTLFDLCNFLEDKRFREVAIQAADWELSTQLPNGSFPSNSFTSGNHKTLVFDTGQVLQGLVRAYKETKNGKYLRCAQRAADWLVGAQDNDGAWRNHVYSNIPHTYHTRVAWPLLQLYRESPNKRYVDAALKNLEWASGKLGKNGWLSQCSFKPNLNPYTHTLAYAIEGFIESGVLLGEPKYIDLGDKIARQLLRIWETTDFMPGELSTGWKSNVRYSCLTGNAQIAICWLRLYELTKDGELLESAVSLNNYTKSNLIMNVGPNEIKGGLKGSDPIYGRYMRFYLPLWATKFLADSLLLEIQVTRGD